MVFSLSTPKKETEKWKKLSKSSGLICCCNFIRKKQSSICRSPIYTTREFSLDNLQNQIIGENNINTSSKQRPISNNANGHFNKIIIPNNYFSDEIISNREDYLDCDETPLNVRKTKEDLLYNTARTSRTEELIEYPSMSKLIIKIIENEKSEKGKKIDNQRQEDKSVNSMKEVNNEFKRLDG
uniref:Uncharacterized protein n=1 Tax=Meloidogyne enterolobii TaxID=390850 RepID=A0A6V7WKL8_MELEN|nr:unnamed protein product [Meloidogyne enterolobii]